MSYATVSSLLEPDRDIPSDWFKHGGLAFDPYAYLEASGDPHLAEYTVNHDVFRVAWDDAPAIIFAPPGGGKTATRVAVTRSSWYGIEGANPFPLPYNLGMAPLTGSPPTPDEHLRLLLESGACALFTGLAFRPERLFRARPDDILETVSFLRDALPGPLEHYLAMLRESGTPAGLSPILERTYALSAPPQPDALERFCDLLEMPVVKREASERETQFRRLVELLRTRLGFKSILILTDGVDAIVENQHDDRSALQWIEWLLARAHVWRESAVFVKIFLPDAMEPVVRQHVFQSSLALRQVKIVWTSDLLVEMLRKRITVASNGRFESLDAISSPNLDDTERRIVEAIPLLPRATLQVTQAALMLYIQRTGGDNGQLEETDIRAAVSWYQSRSAPSLDRRKSRRSHRG